MNEVLQELQKVSDKGRQEALTEIFVEYNTKLDEQEIIELEHIEQHWKDFIDIVQKQEHLSKILSKLSSRKSSSFNTTFVD